MQENQFTQPVQSENERSADATKGLQMGPVIGSIIVIIVLVLGGLYFIGKKVNKDGVFAPEAVEIINAPDSAIGVLEKQNTSDEVNVIGEDLDTTMLDGLDTELQNIETELNL